MKYIRYNNKTKYKKILNAMTANNQIFNIYCATSTSDERLFYRPTKPNKRFLEDGHEYLRARWVLRIGMRSDTIQCVFLKIPMVNLIIDYLKQIRRSLKVKRSGEPLSLQNGHTCPIGKNNGAPDAWDPAGKDDIIRLYVETGDNVPWWFV